MQLRSSIRAPKRFGDTVADSPTADLLSSMRQARGKSAVEEKPQGDNSLICPAAKSNSGVGARIVELYQSQHPAAFSSLDEQRTSGLDRFQGDARGQCGKKNHDNSTAHSSVRRVRFEQNVLDELEDTLIGEMENRALSNTALNSVYMANLAAMATSSTLNDPQVAPEFEDSDQDVPIDPSEGLAAKVCLKSLGRPESQDTPQQARFEKTV